MAKNKSFGRGKQFLLIAVILLILGAVLLFTETPKEGTISEIVEEPGVVTNVELVGEEEVEMVEAEMEIEESAGIMDESSADSAELVRNYFKSYNGGEFNVACDVIDNEKCNAENEGDVNRFAQEFNKMTEGYENLNIWAVDSADFHSDVICVEYDYKYKNAPEVTLHEIMSFYVVDGKITSRVCEEKTADGEAVDCPILSKRDFCL